VPIDVVYSTDYTRTQSTAQPTAKSKELEIQEYDAHELESFAKLLIDTQEDALVVGHSNTTGVLAGLLVGEEVGAFDESIYNRVYQVVVHKKCSRLHVLHTAFSCDD
jgi:broad specificity phosphatase PhoE